MKNKILFLGDETSPILKWLVSSKELVMQTSEKITIGLIHSNNINFIVSYGYHHILEKNILDLFPDRAINLHIAYLPFNRGADPNFWSFVDNTPKGVTIHYLDEGIDTGDIIVQERVEFDTKQETLATSFEKLQSTIQDLFKQNWQDIKKLKCKRQKQVGNGTYHKVKDKRNLHHLLEGGWDTPLNALEKYSVANLTGEIVQLCYFDKTMIGDDYISWLNDPEVVKYSDQSFFEHTKLSSLNYLESFSQTNNLFLAIKEKQTNNLIGTITIYIDKNHGVADLGIMIGNKKYWGCGIGTDTYSLAIKYIFNEYNLRKITSGMPSSHLGMIKVVERSGMSLEGIRAQQQIFCGVLTDTLHYAIFNKYENG